MASHVFTRLLHQSVRAFSSATIFNVFYTFSSDPFNVENAYYDKCKRDVVLDFAARRNHAYALDIGCGTGVLTNLLAEHCNHILGIDFSAKAIDIARIHCSSKNNIELKTAGFDTFESDATYDLFICSEILYYFNRTQLLKAVRKISSLANPGSWLIVIGRADDNYVIPILRNAFSLIYKIEKDGWFLPFKKDIIKISRPFSICVFEVSPNPSCMPTDVSMG